MNHLVFLDTQAGELEKILSGIISMVVKEFDPARSAGQAVRPGDNLYFLRNKDECTLRVKATVVCVLPVTNNLDDSPSQTLKEMQSKLQFTEDQFDYWSVKKQVLLVEFESAQKISAINVDLGKEEK